MNNAIEKGLLFPQNMGPSLSIDETSLSLGELYTILTNKNARGKKGTIVAIVKGTQSDGIIPLLKGLPQRLRNQVKEVTMDLAGSMNLIVKHCFPYAKQVIDRFHVQQLGADALQEIRIQHRWKAIEAENKAQEKARKNQAEYHPKVYANGDTLKQLLARSRHLLYKAQGNWSEEQQKRASLLFELYPDLGQAYALAQKLAWIYNHSCTKSLALTRLAQWYDQVEKAGFKTFNTLSKTIQLHYERILNFFDHRSTNASAESFNAKIKAFRSQFRGVKDVPFFLFRLTKLFA